MVVEPGTRPDLQTLLPRILKGLRRLRDRRAADVAAALDMPIRSFEHFESGKGRLNIERVHQVAEVLDADPHAILAALEMRSPAFALRCADNKLMTILMMSLQDFDARAGDSIARLDPLTLIQAFTQLFDQLAAHAEAQQAAASQWSGRRAAGEGSSAADS